MEHARRKISLHHKFHTQSASVCAIFLCAAFDLAWPISARATTCIPLSPCLGLQQIGSAVLMAASISPAAMVLAQNATVQNVSAENDDDDDVSDEQMKELMDNATTVTIVPTNNTHQLAEVDLKSGFDTFYGFLQGFFEGVVNHPNQALFTIGVLAISACLLASRNFWWPFVHRRIFARMHCRSLRNVECIGRLCGMLPCFPPYHPHFRLRILVMEGERLACNEAYVNASCGNNPDKTTSQRKVPQPPHTVVWNEPLDLDVATVDELVVLAVYDEDNEFVGRAVLVMSEIWKNLKGDLSTGKYLAEGVLSRRLVAGRHVEGQIVFALYATHYGQALPETSQRMEQAPLLG